MPTLVACPKCQRKLRVPDDLLGKSVKCPSCQEAFTADAGTAATLALPPGQAGDERVADRPMPPPERDEEERITGRPRFAEDEEEEDYADDEAPETVIPAADWQKVRRSFSFLLASALTTIGAILEYIVGICILSAAIGAQAAKAAQAGGGGPPPNPMAEMMTGIVVLVVVMLMTLLIGYVLGLIGHILGLASPRARGAKRLAVWVLVVSIVSLVLSIVPYVLAAAAGGPNTMLMLMGGAGNPMFAGAGGGFGAGGGVEAVPEWLSISNLVLGGINNLLTVAALFLFGFYVRAIALCLGADSLRRSVKGWMIMVGVAVVLGLVVVLAFFVMFKDMIANAGAGAAPPPGGLPPGMSPGNLVAFAGVACLFGVVALALLVWYIIMLAQARTAISARAFQR
jgi:hypothetical protein